MSTTVPTISVTSEPSRRHCYEHHSSSISSDSDDNSSNDKSHNQNIGGITDIEDFDSYAELEGPHSRRSLANILGVPKTVSNNQGDATDVEDYNDSEADEIDNKSATFPDLKLSLQEFLQHDFEKHLTTSDGVKEIVHHKSGNFLKAQNLNTITGYLTDCEDLSTDSDIEDKYEKSACVDLKEIIMELGNVDIADFATKIKDHEDSDCEVDNISVASDLSGVASALSDIMYKEQHIISEDEFLDLSSNAEICQISCSESDSISCPGHISEDGSLSSTSIPPIDITFIRPTNKTQIVNNSFSQGASSKTLHKKMFLDVDAKKSDEVLTDTERFDDSVAESRDDDSFDDDDENQQPIPQAIILAVGDDGGCVTDCEELPCDDVSEGVVLPPISYTSVDPITIPLPQREVVILQENKFGDTITSVMPMNKEYQFGIYAAEKDQCLTDTEEYSCADDFDTKVAMVDLSSPPASPSTNNIMVESDVTIANEMLKIQQSKRLEIISNTESVTDVEEIYMAGTNSRKKRTKSRAVTKGKSKLLETPKSNHREDSFGTDIEDIDLTENRLMTPFKYVQKGQTARQSVHSHSERVTDVEEITGDDMSSVYETEFPFIDTNTSNLKEYDASSKNIMVTLESCGSPKKISKKKTYSSDIIRGSYLSINQDFPQQQTDVEYIQFPSDTEECMNVNVSTVDCVCQELNEMLNESCTTVHEKCSNSFNIDAESLYIKGMVREYHTDIEYVESDESAARGSK